MKADSHNEWIPNIILGQDYDRRYVDALIHYDELNNLATFFGRDMPVHRHAQYLQIHFINSGQISFHIDDKIYQTHGASCFLTPASVPHSFLTEAEATGHVLTIHQSVIWDLLKDGLQQALDTDLSEGRCVYQAGLTEDKQAQWALLTQTIETIRQEWRWDNPEKPLVLLSLVRYLIIQIVRLSADQLDSLTVAHADLQLFHRFSALIEQHFKQHLKLTEYLNTLGVSESRLGQICLRISNRSPKKLIHDRMIQECKRLLTFTTLSSSDICYALGFTDPAYFSRFFKRHTGMTTQIYRDQHK